MQPARHADAPSADSACLHLIIHILASQIRSATADRVELEVVWDDPHGGELLEVFAVRTDHPPNNSSYPLLRPRIAS